MNNPAHDYAPTEKQPAKLARLAVPILCGLTGLLSQFTIEFVGSLPVGELVLLAVFPVVVFFRIYRREWPALVQQNRWFTTLLFGVIVMAVGYVISDLYRSSPTGNLLRGWARVAFLGVDLVAVTGLIGGSWKRLWIFALGVAAGQVTQAVIAGPLAGEYWKFCFGFPLTVLLLYAIAERGRWIQIMTAFAMGVLHLALSYRSMGGICLLIAAILYLREAQSRWRWPLTLIALTVVWSAITLVQSRFEEEDAHRGSNLERQSMIEVSSDAFLESPLVGQGSWFTTRMISKVEEKRARTDESFGEYTQEQINEFTIHSQILLSLAEGGILGGAFFFVFGALLLTAFRCAWLNPAPRRALVLLLLCDALWNYAMSPFSGSSRVWICVAVALCLLLWQEHRHGSDREYVHE